jgi:hypothetical protein
LFVALAEIGDVRSISAIEWARSAELDGRVKRCYRNAITQLREKGSPGDKLRKLGEEVERLREEATRLREGVETREARPAGAKPSTTPGYTPPPAKRPRPGGHRTGCKTLAPRRR